MKKILLLLLFLPIISVFADETEYRIGENEKGPQIFDGRGNRITDFKGMELVENFFVSPDGTKMLVCHLPENEAAYMITLYDLRNRKIVAECEHSRWACRDVRWMKDCLIYIWATSGGGWRFEYRSYSSLELKRCVTSYFPFEDLEDNILIDPEYQVSKEIVFYDFSNGETIKTVKCNDELYPKLWASGEPKIKAAAESGKGIYANVMTISNIRRTGRRKYRFDIDYIFFVEGDETGEERTAVLEVVL